LRGTTRPSPSNALCTSLDHAHAHTHTHTYRRAYASRRRVVGHVAQALAGARGYVDDADERLHDSAHNAERDAAHEPADASLSRALHRLHHQT
jgi:hypothetical protein